MDKFKGWGGGWGGGGGFVYVIQNQVSPGLIFPEIGIAAFVRFAVL